MTVAVRQMPHAQVTDPIWIGVDLSHGVDAWSLFMPQATEIFVEHWEFQAGEPVPGWLEHAEGVAQLTFTVDVTVHKDMNGGFWVVPMTPTECPIHGVGYGPETPVRIHGQGRGGVRVLSRPLVDVVAYLSLPRD